MKNGGMAGPADDHRSVQRGLAGRCVAKRDRAVRAEELRGTCRCDGLSNVDGFGLFRLDRHSGERSFSAVGKAEDGRYRQRLETIVAKFEFAGPAGFGGLVGENFFLLHGGKARRAREF